MDQNKKPKKEAPAIVRVLIGELILAVLMVIIWLILGMKPLPSNAYIVIPVFALAVGVLSYKI